MTFININGTIINTAAIAYMRPAQRMETVAYRYVISFVSGSSVHVEGEDARRAYEWLQEKAETFTEETRPDWALYAVWDAELDRRGWAVVDDNPRNEGKRYTFFGFDSLAKAQAKLAELTGGAE